MSDSVLIECTIQRPNGTLVDFPADNRDGKTVYHFKDDGLGRHVAPVADEDHIARFLSIPEAYRLIRTGGTGGTGSAGAGIKAPAAPVEPPTAPVAAVAKTQVQPITTTTEPVVDPGTQPEPPKELTEAEQLDAARVQYEQVFGQPARKNVKLETLLAKIEAHGKATQAG